jgi:membrane protein implicated in regulation of membrane protease activity
MWVRFKQGFERMWSPSEILFQIFWDGFLVTLGFIVALKLVGYRGIALTYFEIATFVFALFAILTVVRLRMAMARENKPKKEFGVINRQIRDKLQKIKNKKL